MPDKRRDASTPKATPDESTSPTGKRWWQRLDFQNNEKHFRIAVLLVVLLAAILRGKVQLESMHVALWNDELLAAQWSTGRSLQHNDIAVGKMIDAPAPFTHLDNARPVWELFTALKNDVQAPLHYMVLRGWREIFGSSDFAMQSLSLLASTAAVLFLVLGVRHLSGPVTALWAGLLMAAAPTQLLFAREVRPYALGVFFTLVTFWAFMLVWKKGGKWWHYVLLAAATFCSVFTHYYGVGVPLALAVWAVIVLRGRQRWLTLAAFAVAGLVFLGVWGRVLVAQYKNTQTSGNIEWMQDAPGEEVSLAMARALGAPLRLFADIGQWGDQEYILIHALSFVIFGICTVRLVWRRELSLPWLMMVISLLIVAALDIKSSSKQLTFSRFLIFASPGFYILIAGLVSRSPQRGWSQLAPALVFAGAMVATFLGLTQEKAQTFLRVPYDIVCDIYATDGRPTEPIVFYTPGKRLLTQNTYMGIAHYARERPQEIMLLDMPPTGEQIAALQQHESFWCMWMFYRRARARFDGFVPVDRYLMPEAGMVIHFRRADRVDPRTYRAPELKIIGPAAQQP